MPAMSTPSIQAQRLSFPSAIGSEGEDTLPLNITAFMGNAPHSLTEDAVAFVSGSVRVQKIGDDFIGTVDAMSVNTILNTDHISSLEPDNESTVTFQLTGSVTAVADRSFTIETGHYDFESKAIVRWRAICDLLPTRRWQNVNPPTVGSHTTIRARWTHNTDLPHFSIEELTYLPCTPTTSTPSPKKSPTKKPLFKRKADGDGEGTSCKKGRPTPITTNLPTPDTPINVPPDLDGDAHNGMANNAASATDNDDNIVKIEGESEKKHGKRRAK
ncbi:hypothetical protein BS47DRAFT_1400944 [Hydnum rufescens UP504]|uniref:Uncharacterized protein n=1 Tax=Hydnum rufescens UP504 TaxID=1448309 RepID=A0A9P6DN78_9AGAM|nr:hypothetical protein BS47DRAFT_1400944 [Hydnum rufescens UP504]